MDKTGAFLAHYGVLGMHWGQRKQITDTSGRPQTQQEKRAKNTRRKAIVGSAGLAVLAGVGAAYAAKRFGVKLPLKKMKPKIVNSGRDAVNRFLKKKPKVSADNSSFKLNVKDYQTPASQAAMERHRHRTLQALLEDPNLSPQDTAKLMAKFDAASK